MSSPFAVSYLRRDRRQRVFYFYKMAKREFTGVFIPAHIWTSKDLLPAEKMLLGEIDALSKNYDWCDAGRDHFAEWLQCTPQNVSYYIKKLSDMGFIEVEKRPGFASRLRVIQERFRIPEKPGVENGVFGGRKRGFPEIQEEIQEKEIQEEIQQAPLCEKQTVVTLHTPDQISETSVTVVEEVVFSLEAEKEPKANIPPAAGAPRKPRATKPPVDRSAEIADHLGTDELKTFFAAIQPEWAKWIAYKTIEKKGKYKAVETEAAAVAAFARKTGYDPAAAALAIEHSILGSYQGIFLPKADNKPQAAPAPRYSFADSPQAHTPEQMLQEVRAFYTAHVDELQAIQTTAGTAYRRERLTEVITAFCAHRVKIGKASESFERQNGALCSWLQEEKKRDAARVAGPGAQTVQYSTRAAAEIRYAKREEI